MEFFESGFEVFDDFLGQNVGIGKVVGFFDPLSHKIARLALSRIFFRASITRTVDPADDLSGSRIRRIVCPAVIYLRASPKRLEFLNRSVGECQIL